MLLRNHSDKLAEELAHLIWKGSTSLYSSIFTWPTEVVAQLQLTAFQIVAVVLVILAAKPMKMFVWSPQKGCAGSGRQLLESNSHLPHADMPANTDTVLGISWSPWYWPVSWRADIRHGLQQAFKQTVPHTNGATQQVEQKIFLLIKTQLSPPDKLEGTSLWVTEESLHLYSCTVTELVVIGWGGSRGLQPWMVNYYRQRNGFMVT